MRRWRAMLAGPLLLGAISCARRDASEADPAKALPLVRVARVEWQVFEQEIEAPGQWRSTTETVVSAPFDVVVESLAGRPGERVARGAQLGRFTTYESHAAIQGAQLWRGQARDSATVRDAERALRAAREAVVSVPIVAPVSGVIVRRSADPGARLTAGAELLAIVSDDDVVFEARLRAADAAAIRAGMPAVLEDGSEPPLDAKVLNQLPTAGGDQSVLVWLQSGSRRQRLDLGRFGTARIHTGGRMRVLALPDSAIVEDDLTGRQRVAAVDASGRVAWVDVRPVARHGGMRGVTSDGLAAGARVIVEGQRSFEDGVEVRTQP